MTNLAPNGCDIKAKNNTYSSNFIDKFIQDFLRKLKYFTIL